MRNIYSEELKQSLIRRMLAPENASVARLSYATGISDRNKWSLKKKLAVIKETASLNEHDLSAYCRKNGLYVDQINQWEQYFIDASRTSSEPNVKVIRAERRELKAENKILKKEIRRKDKALAETAALLVLRKKVIAIWEEREAG